MRPWALGRRTGCLLARCAAVSEQQYHDFNPVSKAEWTDPYAYLSDVLKRLPTHKVTQIEELLLL